MIKNIMIVIGVEILETIISILNRFSLVTGDLSIITTITSCSIIITVLTSMIVFKEKISFKKWLIIFPFTSLLFLILYFRCINILPYFFFCFCVLSFNFCKDMYLF